MRRDKTLDLVRGAAVLHVLLVHILFWLNIFGTGPLARLRSFLLFEMPVFFFVTGAVNCIGERRTYGSFCLRRAKGLLIPYYGYALLCVILAAAVDLARHRFTAEGLVRTALSWLIPLDRQIMPLPFFTWAVWFVPVYLLVILVFPLVRRASEAFGGAAVTSALILLFLAVDSVGTLPDLLRETAFYLVFAAAGTQWPALKRRKDRCVPAAVGVFMVSAAGMLFCRYVLGGDWEMQANKFPPNRMFLFFSLAALSGLYLLLPAAAHLWRSAVRRIPVLEKMVLLYSGNSIYAFLWQSFAFLAAARLLDRIRADREAAGFLLSVTVVYSMVTGGLWMAGWIRRRKRKLAEALKLRV